MGGNKRKRRASSSSSDSDRDRDLPCSPPRADELGPRLFAQDDQLKDFRIQVEGVEVAVHRSVLAAQSPVLEAMVLSGLSEAKEAKLVMEDGSAATVRLFVKFLYGVQLPAIPPELVVELYRLADKYQVGALKEEVVRRLCLSLHEGLAYLGPALAVAEASNHHQLLYHTSGALASALREKRMPADLWAELCEPKRQAFQLQLLADGLS